MNDIAGKPGELRMTVSITRKATGEVETYELVGHATPEQDEQLKELTNGCDTQHGGEKRGD